MTKNRKIQPLKVIPILLFAIILLAMVANTSVASAWTPIAEGNGVFSTATIDDQAFSGINNDVNNYIKFNSGNITGKGISFNTSITWQDLIMNPTYWGDGSVTYTMTLMLNGATGQQNATIQFRDSSMVFGLDAKSTVKFGTGDLAIVGLSNTTRTHTLSKAPSSPDYVARFPEQFDANGNSLYKIGVYIWRNGYDELMITYSITGYCTPQEDINIGNGQNYDYATVTFNQTINVGSAWFTSLDADVIFSWAGNGHGSFHWSNDVSQDWFNVPIPSDNYNRQTGTNENKAFWETALQTVEDIYNGCIYLAQMVYGMLKAMLPYLGMLFFAYLLDAVVSSIYEGSPQPIGRFFMMVWHMTQDVWERLIDILSAAASALGAVLPF